MASDGPFCQFMARTEEALASAYGSGWRVANMMEGILQRAGFVNITCKKFKMPIGRWPKVSDAPCCVAALAETGRRIRNSA
jgi:hypothetical protein